MTELAGTNPDVLLLPGTGAILRRISPEHSEEMFELIDRNRPHLSQFGDETAAKYPTLESVRERNENQDPNEKRFGIWDSDALVGFVKVTKKDRGWEVGYWMGEEYTGKGYMTMAVRRITDYAKAQLGAENVWATVHKDNKASQRVLEKAEFVSKGTNPDKETDFLYEYEEQ